MLGLNNKGWGTRTMIILTSIILIALLIATYYVIALYSNIDKDKNDKKRTSVFENNKVTKDEEVYNQYEINMQNAAIKYAKEYNFETTSDFYVIPYSFLVEFDYMDRIKDVKSKQECDGYVKLYSIVYSSYSAKAYIKCSNYTTEDYDSSFTLEDNVYDIEEEGYEE